MFGSSTQFKFWTFKDENEIENLRIQANKDFIAKHGSLKSIPVKERDSYYLTVQQELLLVKHYENSLREFCRKFRDPRDHRIRMPLNVSSTAQHYFKRFYLYNSVMDYHPKEILVTCVYLACKIEEFYVTINDFVFNVKGDKRKAAEIILNNELQLTQELQFHLIIHQPYRPVEGLMIDIKTRYPELNEPERLRHYIEEFLAKVQLTDAILLYSPSQIALAAVTTAVSKLQENLDSYVTDILFRDNPGQMAVLIEAVRKIKRIVKGFDAAPLDDQTRKGIEARLEVCRNQENNPNSSQYRANLSEWDDEDELAIVHDVDPNQGVGSDIAEIKRIVKGFDAAPLDDQTRKGIEARLEVCRNQENNPNSSQYRANLSEWDDEDELAIVHDVDPNQGVGSDIAGIHSIRSPASY